MFTYFHCYLPETWDAQVKAGLVGKNDGIRFVQALTVKPEKSFNRIAARDGELYSLVRNNRLPFYIDRLQGGCYMENYPYDMSLVDEYRSMLGDKFYGFQMHEWMSNINSDLSKMKEGGITGWTAEEITEAIKRAYPFPYLFLEAMNADEYAEYPKPETLEDIIAASKRLFAKRQSYVNGDLLPCDSYYQALPIELECGAKRIMPEIGAQTLFTNIQLAYTRGMARAKGIEYGAYTEPWGGEPFTTCSYHCDDTNEWGIVSTADFPFNTGGPNGGSSRSMQMRMQLYAYMAGASFMAEEWGMCNTFNDWQDFELSPYGKVKLDFIRFTEKYPDIGKPVTPIAVVIPSDLPVLQNLSERDDYYLSFPVIGDFARRLRIVRSGLRKLFCESEPLIGSPRETVSLLNCYLPDVFDIVNESYLKAENYEYLIDLTGSSSLSQKYAHKIIGIDEVESRLDASLPCKFTGGAMKQLTRTDDGSFYVLLMNNSGVVRTVADGEYTLRDADTVITVEVKNGAQLTQKEGNSKLSRAEDGKYYVNIPAGGHFFGRLGK